MAAGLSRVGIDPRIIYLLTGWAQQAGQKECCGLLFGSRDHILSAERTANVAENPRSFFEIDPARLIAAERAAREGGPGIAGYFHSHPNGNAEPSPTDAAMASPDGRLWLIIAQGATSCWRAVECGALHGRFDPVDLERVECGLAMAEQDRH